MDWASPSAFSMMAAGQPLDGKPTGPCGGGPAAGLTSAVPAGGGRAGDGMGASLVRQPPRHRFPLFFFDFETFYDSSHSQTQLF